MPTFEWLYGTARKWKEKFDAIDPESRTAAQERQFIIEESEKLGTEAGRKFAECDVPGSGVPN